MKPTILESCEDVIAIEKYLHTIGVIKDDEPAKDSRDARRKSHAMESNGRDKEATDIETLTHLIKNLTTEASELIKTGPHRLPSAEGAMHLTCPVKRVQCILKSPSFTS